MTETAIAEARGIMNGKIPAERYAAVGDMFAVLELSGYLFLDEIQDAEGWQGGARRIAEHEDVTLVLTGSSSKLSSSQIATEFRGRSHTHEMLPCSFSEHLRFHEEELPASLGAAENRKDG